MPTAADTASNLGYSMAFFNSHPDLKRLLNSAVKENWTPAKFVAMLQNTNWFKTQGEAARQMYALRTSDPATFKQRSDSAYHQVTQAAMAVGAVISSTQAKQLANMALTMGWTDDQLKHTLSNYIKPNTRDGTYRGQAGGAVEQIRGLMSDYGIKPSSAQVGAWVKGIMSGNSSIEQIKAQVINQTASKFPGLKERLLQGETLEAIAAPYKDSYSRVLEVNPRSINLSDPKIQKALASKDAKGKPTTQTVWQFEQDLKEDPRWLQTKNAQDSLVGETHKVLQSFGLMN